MKRRSAIPAVIATAFTLLSSAQAQTTDAGFPTKVVRLVIPFAAGQGSDILARAMSDRLAKLWKQPVIVDNKPGANGAIAIQDVAKSAPDGHTLLLTSNSPIVINPNIYKKLPYDAAKDLKPITMIALTDLVLVVNPKFEGKTWQEVATTIKANPQKFSYASPGLGSTSNLSMEIFKQEIGGDVVHVPYKGSAPAMTDIIGGNIDLMIDAMPSALPHIRSGRVRAIGLTGKKTSSIAPDIPTSAMSGFHNLPEGAWYGIFAQGGTSDATVNTIYETIRLVLSEPDMKKRIKDQGLEESIQMSPTQFRTFLVEDTQRWEQGTKRIGVYRNE